MFPDSYRPHVLRGMMLIVVENETPQGQRGYSTALTECEAARNMLRSSDNTTYYQQIESLIDSLRQNGWL